MASHVSLRQRVSRVKQMRAYAPLAVGGRAAGYVGWVGNGNQGDEAMYAAHRVAMPSVRFVPLPNIPDNAVLKGLGRAGRLRSVCLGGGTLIGNGHFRRTLEAALSADPAAGAFMLGVGVEDPAFSEGRRAGVLDELAAWRGVLGSFDEVRVRGPLSQAALARIDVPSVVTGDPALLLDAVPGVQVRTGTIGVNVGTTDEMWGNDEDELHQRTRELVNRLTAGGWRVRLISTTTQDTAVLRDLSRDCGVDYAPATDLATLRRSLAECQVVIAQKLHALVLAAVECVPGIALEYRPKCRDFQASMGRAEYVVRTDDVDVTGLLAMAEAIASDDQAQRSRLAHHVELSRHLLRDAASAAMADPS